MRTRARRLMRQHRDLLINLNLLFLTIITGTVVVVIAWRVLEVIFSVLILLLAAMLLAFLLSPLVSRLEAARLPRVVAVLAVYLGLLALIFGLGGLLVVPLANQIRGLAAHLPKEINQLGPHITALDK